MTLIYSTIVVDTILDFLSTKELHTIVLTVDIVRIFFIPVYSVDIILDQIVISVSIVYSISHDNIILFLQTIILQLEISFLACFVASPRLALHCMT